MIFISVAEHSLLVEELFGRLSPKAAPIALAALLPTPGMRNQDMISPVKAAVGPGWRWMIGSQCHPFAVWSARRSAQNNQAADQEGRQDFCLYGNQIAGFSVAEAQKFFGLPDEGILEATLH